MGLVFKIFAPGGSFHGVDYNEKKQRQGSADLVYFENFGHFQDGRTEISKREFVQYFEKWSARNSRVVNPQFHAMLSCKEREYTHERLKEVALDIMDKMGYSAIPVLIYAHRDTDNNHVHIVTSRVGADGKKVNHDFEHKRSHEILNQILQIEPAEVYKKDLEEVMSYKYGSVALMALLMERRGYNVSDKEPLICFYKNGRQQGFVSKEEVRSKISVEKSLSDTNQIKAWLYKYAAKHDSKVVVRSSPVYTTKAKEFKSKLTDELKKKFGLEFVFFSGKEKDKPYGYAIIDHNHKTVYKGSDVLKLDLLDALSSTVAQLAKATVGEEREPVITAELRGQGEISGPLGAEKGGKEPELFPMGNIMELSLEGLQSILNTANRQDMGETSQVVKRKRKRGF
jgi:hypothetical protein